MLCTRNVVTKKTLATATSPNQTSGNVSIYGCAITSTAMHASDVLANDCDIKITPCNGAASGDAHSTSDVSLASSMLHLHVPVRALASSRLRYVSLKPDTGFSQSETAHSTI